MARTFMSIPIYTVLLSGFVISFEDATFAVVAMFGGMKELQITN